MQPIKVLFVCMGNICRSPTAEGVFVHLLKQNNALDRFEVDSAGTHAYHVGEPADSRAQQTARQRGIDLSFIRARKFTASDFAHFDYILAMDSDNLAILQRACPEEYQHKVQLFLDYATQFDESDVPDPYYGGPQGFEHVFDLVTDAASGFYQKITH
ncbi:Low molecular weight protein tyrosine phosphatase [Methylophaga frappieri]|uniref:protein-tyrosine-phosphatase n=1 Tax=Methylophaga frappieri (strain ATCC BAA-2434 / DSM 25690 / JAM7) TaxID=754477 RepID=I1YH61_METFJ|nr:low molecular weight protein-tyrosine-phosphatase [Methylophaga frappieri]AFJ02254.1 Low molecular weight protein tyrosine phosphatase [Methylophaga frappieri]